MRRLAAQPVTPGELQNSIERGRDRMLSSIDPANNLIIGLPGVLARPEEQFAPVEDVLWWFGDVDYVSYGKGRTDADAVIAEAVKLAHDALATGKTVTIVGLSLGAYFATYARAALMSTDLYASMERLHLLLVDGPGGGDTLYAIPPKALRVAKAVTQLHLPKSLSYPKAMQVPPEPENIAVPAGLTPEQEVAYKEKVIADARTLLSKHEMTTFTSQVNWMAGAGWGNLPLGYLKGVDSTYIGNVSEKNNTVRQPDALKKWAPHVRNPVIEVPTAHVALGEERDLYRQLFLEQMTRIVNS